ncbi:MULTISPECIES: glycoside hydrolase family 3 N-terminal domain-containing protein [unclassified Actinomyces]|uniref:glycoside hydrolase family 3 N-terminal domain-containing protein n=1 Tax=unclassified Actinomyces TaxID=2609248 RepID=UPI0020170971|nr:MULTISPECIES: glycoside hydrolase family 3 N-terminal domain-containing protein [unclassified Actinomyces]MCL3777403.1 glycoside hydrolase family 3 C-terminal domain-containing protein [Actinomyces sp. AC-20-1]MCL3789075.1 glycoside hydrolase family 3 C-terminal domain-containing protein [Actinomyces sp. 187325]MCL3791648.1 glycoside hydrolase family 3 C-terminal domain-containing protein [Actinomyces sp. 186855]MCL3793876.1 glycoside hydrolase family 3 C-terminal domain-containing protein [
MTTQRTYPYQDPSLSVTERVEDLLSRLSTAEKIGQLRQYFYVAPHMDDIPEEHIAHLPAEHQEYARQPGRIREAIDRGEVGSLLFVTDPEFIRGLQERAVAGSRWGIPLLFGYDVIHGLRTIFPVPVATAASWDPQVAEEGQRVAATEASAVGIRWTFAPMVDIARDPRWGRIIEGAGEDACLGGAMAAAQVRGFQAGARTGEAFPADALLAGPKHFAGYGAAEGGRDYEDVDLSDDLLHNVYYPPFTAAIEAGAGNVMAAYMDLNGVPAAANRHLLTGILRDELGFEGFVVSDANGVNNLVTQHLVADDEHAGARALAAGLDMEMANGPAAYEHLAAALEAGLVDEAALDTAVRRVLAAKVSLGLFENPYADVPRAAEVLAEPSHREAARRAAEKSLVLLENDGTLPLAASGARAVRRVAVLGDLAASQRDVLGPWVFAEDVAESVSLLEGLRARAEQAGVTLEHARALATAERVQPSMFDRMDEGLLPTTPEGFDADAELDRAIGLAATSDVALVVVGQNQNQIGEKSSASTLDLPGRQAELLRRTIATGTPTVVLVMSGRPLDLRPADGAAAVLQVWYPGTRGGEAVAAAVFGDVSPAGRLPFTWPQHVGQVPVHYAHRTTFDPQGATTRYWNEASHAPRYVFGHGLSYAAFDYSPVQVPQRLAVGETGTVAVEVTNTSAVDADEVVQLYTHQRYGETTRPVRELKGFARVHVPAGRTVTVELPLGPEQLRYWSSVSRTWVQEPTVVDIAVGGSSAAPFTAQVEVTP